MSTSLFRQRHWILALAVATVLVGIGARGVWTPDEPRVAAVTLEMADRGEFVVPHLAGEPFVEKPPLYFGVGAALVRAVGGWIGEIAAIRLASALFALATLLFTWRLGRILSGPEAGALAVVVLATMFAFAEQATMLRVDIALLAFVTGAVWAFTEAYLCDRPALLPLAGALSGVAMLSKGLIGPALIFPAWVAGFLPWLNALRRRGDAPVARLVSLHVVGLLAALAVCGAWVAAFHAAVEPEVWRFWLLDNQLGRFAGTAKLGHMHGFRPDFYLPVVVGYTAPWLPLAVAWAIPIVRARRASRAQLLLASWALGGVIVLSVSVSKRNLYLLPLIPAFALMCSDIAVRGLPRWGHLYCRGVAWAAGLVPLVLLGAPILGLLLGIRPTGPVGASLLFEFAPVHLLVAATLGVCVWLAWQQSPLRIGPLAHAGGAAAAAWLAYNATCLPAADRFKNVSREAHALVEEMSRTGMRIAAFKFKETNRGFLYVYGRRSFALIRSCERANRILAGRDAEFDALLIPGDKLEGCVDTPHRVVATAYLGARGRPPKPRKYLYLLSPEVLDEQAL